MGLTVVKPPAGTAEAACWIVGRLRAGRGFQTRGALASAAPEEPLWLSTPHPVFNLGLDDLVPSATFDAVRMTGWRYIVQSRERALATVEFSASSHTDPPRFCRVTDGTMAASVARAIGHAEHSAAVRKGRYVLGMVRIPEILTYALWLRDDRANGVHDLFSVLKLSPPRSTAGTLLTRTKFMNQLAGIGVPRAGA